MTSATLLILSGLPGVGKTTIARLLAKRMRAMHLRIDTIEEALEAAMGDDRDIGAAGYVVAYRLAEDQLRLGQTVVADAVNPLEIARQSWRDVAARCGARAVEVEIVCSNPATHRHRVESRLAGTDGRQQPDWAAVVARVYEPWTRERCLIDTADLSPEKAAGNIMRLAALGREVGSMSDSRP